MNTNNDGLPTPVPFVGPLRHLDYIKDISSRLNWLVGWIETVEIWTVD